jgi:hypothetical protein
MKFILALLRATNRNRCARSSALGLRHIREDRVVEDPACAQPRIYPVAEPLGDVAVARRDRDLLQEHDIGQFLNDPADEQGEPLLEGGVVRAAAASPRRIQLTPAVPG